MKNIMKILGIIAIVAVIGLSMTGCEPEPETKTGDTVDIIVTNNSIYTYVDSTVKAQVWGTMGGTVPLQEKSVSIGTSVTFTMVEGNYRVCVIDGMNYKDWYPSESSVINMTGTVRLSFTGSSLVRQ